MLLWCQIHVWPRKHKRFLSHTPMFRVQHVVTARVYISSSKKKWKNVDNEPAKNLDGHNTFWKPPPFTCETRQQLVHCRVRCSSLTLAGQVLERRQDLIEEEQARWGGMTGTASVSCRLVDTPYACICSYQGSRKPWTIKVYVATDFFLSFILHLFIFNFLVHAADSPDCKSLRAPHVSQCLSVVKSKPPVRKAYARSNDSGTQRFYFVLRSATVTPTKCAK